MKRIKAAIIGAGSAAMLIHAPYLSIHPEVDLAAIVDPVEKSAKSVAERFHIKKTYRHFQEMLRKEKPDVVHVATPQSLHSKHSIAAMEAGADVLCEKPMACSLEECDAMIGAAKRTGLKLMIGFMKRWNIGLEKVKEILDSEELGKPFFAYVHHTLKASRIYERWQKLEVQKSELQCGGIALGLIHYVDTLRWMMGDIESVQGVISNIFPKIVTCESFANINARFANGASASFVLGAGPTYDFEEGDEGGFFCTKGNILFKIFGSFNLSPPYVKLQNANGDWRQISFRTDPVNLSHWHYKREIDYWIDCVKNDKQVSPSGVDGRKAQEVIYALYQSWFSGKRIFLPLKKTPSLRVIFEKLTKEALF